MVLFVGAIAGSVAVAFSTLDKRARKKRQDAFRVELEKAGITDIDTWGNGNAKGHWGPLNLRIERARNMTRRVQHVSTCRVWGGEHTLHEVTLSRRELFPLQQMLKGKRGLHVEDETFDQTFDVDGPTARVRALLDERTRSMLVELNRNGNVSLSDGVLSLSVEQNSSEIVSRKLLSALRNAAQRLTHPHPIFERLIENALKDSQPGVRSSNLIALAREYGAYTRTKETLLQACSDVDPDVRLVAASHLGEQGYATLRELAEGDGWAAPKAIIVLGENLPLTRAPSLLREALARGRLDVVESCIMVLGRHGGAEHVDVLVPLLSQPEERVEVAMAAARALGELHAPAAETALIDKLQAGDVELRVAVADALSLSGSVAAVLSLREASERFREREFRRAARQAIATIQSRVPAEAAGRVSLAEAAGGEVSLVESETGKVSLVESESENRALVRQERSRS